MTPSAILVLYVVDGSAACDAAVANLGHTLRHFRGDQVSVTIRNLSHEPLRLGEPPLLMVPTLVVHTPTPELVAGDLADEEVERLLDELGIERAQP